MMTGTKSIKKILWWGRSDISYTRNGVIRNVMSDLEIKIIDFKPRLSKFGHIEAFFASFYDVDAVWVPCFRQRDLKAASKWAKKKNIPLIFDPLISAYDKQVFERKKFSQISSSAKKLLKWEMKLFQLADIVVADTNLHAKYFEETLGVDPARIHILPVSSEENIFTFKEKKCQNNNQYFNVLYFGNYLELHGVDVIAGTICSNSNKAIRWTLVGDGVGRSTIEEKCKGISRVEFIDWIDYHELPKLIHNSDLVLGIFDIGEKASRVIPNKVYQALACGCPVATRKSEAYPEEMLNSTSGIQWVEAGDSSSLLEAIERSIGQNRAEASSAARKNYEKFFSNNVVKGSLKKVLASNQN